MEKFFIFFLLCGEETGEDDGTSLIRENNKCKVLNYELFSDAAIRLHYNYTVRRFYTVTGHIC